jgi:hypothetical protein
MQGMMIFRCSMRGIYSMGAGMRMTGVVIRAGDGGLSVVNGGGRRSHSHRNVQLRQSGDQFLGWAACAKKKAR